MCHFDQNFKNHQATGNNSHTCRLQCTNCPRIPAKRFKLLILSKKTLHAILPHKIIITYSSYETPDKNSENSLANDDRNLNMVPNENTFQGLSNGSNSNLLSVTVMAKISKNTTKPPVQCHIENYKNPENSSKNQPSVSFLPQPISTCQETAENGGHRSLRGNDTTQGCNVSERFTTITLNNAHEKVMKKAF